MIIEGNAIMGVVQVKNVMENTQTLSMIQKIVMLIPISTAVLVV